MNALNCRQNDVVYNNYFFHSFGDIVVFDLAGEPLFTIPQVSKNKIKILLFMAVVRSYSYTLQLLLIHKQQTDL